MRKKIALLLALLLTLSVLAGCGAQKTGPYEGVTVLSAEEVQTVVSAVRDAYLAEDWESISQMTRYPIRILDAELNSAEEFLAFMEGKTVHQRDLNDMEQESLEELFFNEDGIRLGNGQVWLADPNYGTKGEPKLEITQLSGIIERTPSAEDLKEYYFDPIIALELGTAGSSLKMGEVGCRMLSYSVSRQVRGADENLLVKNMLEVWNGLSKEERAAFDVRFVELSFLVFMCYDNAENVKGVFEDAGVGEEMEYLLSYPDSRQDWAMLSRCTFAMEEKGGM